jgi:hypothetical protein
MPGHDRIDVGCLRYVENVDSTSSVENVYSTSSSGVLPDCTWSNAAQ